MERHKEAIKAPPIARSVEVMGTLELSPPGDKAWAGLTSFEGTCHREPQTASPEQRLHVLESTGAPKSPSQGRDPSAAHVPGRQSLHC